jgi:hypothetical protein
LAAGGAYHGLSYQPTVLADVTPPIPAYATEVYVPRFADVPKPGLMGCRTARRLDFGPTRGPGHGLGVRLGCYGYQGVAVAGIVEVGVDLPQSGEFKSFA